MDVFYIWVKMSERNTYKVYQLNDVLEKNEVLVSFDVISSTNMFQWKKISK